MASKLKKEKKNENTGKEVMSLFLQYTVIFLTVLIVTILPLALKNGYYQVGDFKFKVYSYLMAGGIIVIVPMLILYAIFCRKEFSLKKLWDDLSITDKFVIAYMIFTLISFFTNPSSMRETLLGYSGWYMGLYSQFTFVFLYFIVSRFAKDYPITIAFLAGTSFITYVLGILNRLMIDPLHNYDGLEPRYYNFISTLGQHTWYSSFLCTFLPFMMGLYMVGKKRWFHIISGIFCLTGFTTLVSQNADSAYMAMFGAFLVLFAVAVKEAAWMRHFVELVLVFFLAGKVMWLLLQIHSNEFLYTEWLGVKLGQISLFFIDDYRSWAGIAILIILWVGVFILEKTDKYPTRVFMMMRNVVYFLILISIVMIVSIIVLGAKGLLSPKQTELVSKIPYLVWSDAWGNARGFTWSVTWKMITEFGPFKLLFGVGPDGFASYGYAHYNELIRSMWGENVLTNAHNEWLTMMVNEGLFGAASYLGIFISAMIRGIRDGATKWVPLAAAACVGAYICHNLFCYQQVLCTPFIFLIMAMGETKGRK